MSSSTIWFEISLESLGVSKAAKAKRDGVKELLFGFSWDNQEEWGLLGIDEGSLFELTPETEWTLDEAAPPPNRDWLESQNVQTIRFFFHGLEGATRAQRDLESYFPLLKMTAVQFEPSRDWNEEWRKSFTPIDVSPIWRIQAPWHKVSESESITLTINPGAGFGTGTHETTQLCLELLAGQALRRVGRNLDGIRVLDFGSGSGILSIAAARLGARVDAVEIDPMAISNAVENSKLSSVTDRIRYSTGFHSESEKYDGVIGNILKSVLIPSADALIARMKAEGFLILSGMLEADVGPVLECYEKGFRKFGFQDARPRVFEKNEWRAIEWIF